MWKHMNTNFYVKNERDTVKDAVPSHLSYAKVKQNWREIKMNIKM